MTGRLSRFLRGLLVPGSVRARAAERWCFVDPFPSGSYNQQFLRSRSGGDFVASPDFLWSPAPYWSERSGLSAQFRELAGRMGGAVFSDVLLVLHPADHARSRASLLQSWEKAARDELAACWERLIESQGWVKAVPERGFHLRVVADGDAAIGQRIGLEPGEFATALLPNLWLGPDPQSAPLAEVFVASDAGGRFRSVGTLWSDQTAFSVGAHPLDNGCVESLGDSAIYTVHRFPGQPGLHHRLNGERAERLRLETGQAHGGETVRVVEPARDKLLLQVMLVSARPLEAELPQRGEESGALPSARGRLPLELPAMGPLCGTILPEDADLGDFGACSIIPEAIPERIHTLSERGFLLQRVHFRREMAGYRVDIDRSSAVLPKGHDPVAQVEVVDNRLSLRAVARDVVLDGRPLAAGEKQPLGDARHSIEWSSGSAEIESIRRPGVERWPYLARLSSPRRATPLPAGGCYSIGRDGRHCEVALPDRAVCDNILWRDGLRSGPVEVQGGRVDRASFRTDAIGVATKAAELDLTTEQPALRNCSETCGIFVLRPDGSTMRVQPGGTLGLQPGDELLVGNQAFVLLAPGVEDRERPDPPATGQESEPATAPSTPPSERLQSGPGSRGRRPQPGGAAGQLVDPARTYGAVLGIAPRATQLGPAPAAAGPSTDSLPSLDLDPTVLDAEPGEDAVPLAAPHGPAESAPRPDSPRPMPRGLLIGGAPPLAALSRFWRRSASPLPGFAPRAERDSSPGQPLPPLPPLPSPRSPETSEPSLGQG